MGRKIGMGMVVAWLLVVSAALSTSVGASDVDTLSGKIFQNALRRAEAGDAAAQYSVGERYEQGKGAPVDKALAYSWYEKAAAQGNQQAAAKLRERDQRIAAEQAKRKAREAREEQARAEREAREAKVRAERQASEAREKQARAESKAREAREEQARAERQAQARAESKARAQATQQASARATVTPTQTQTQTPIQTPTQTPAQTLARLRARKWQANGQPVEFLPSPLTACVAPGDRLICSAQERVRQSGSAQITYLVQSTVAAREGGAFTIEYRYNVTRVRTGEAGAPAGSGPLPRAEKGLQAPINLACTLAADGRATCTGSDGKQLLLSGN